MIISRTPFRISFFGGGTDYPAWYQEHGGAVLATAIDKYCYINCRYLPPFFDHHSRIIYTRIENVTDNALIEHHAVRACLQRMGINAGVEIHHDADLPARTGLGTSSTFVVGLLHALRALLQRPCGPAELAREAMFIEQEMLGETVGAQDQVTAAFGGLNVIRFATSGDFHLEPVSLAATRIADFQAHLHLYFTGFSRTASQIAGKQIANIPTRVGELRKLQAMVDEGCGILTGGGPLSEFGELLHEAWMLKRQLSDRVSNGPLDAMYEHARASGATGGKLLGAGGGGFFLFFVPPEQEAGFCRRMRQWMRVPFSFSRSGVELLLSEPTPAYGDELVRQRSRAYSAGS